MPANRNALIRYKTIDRCLQNRYRKWTLEELMEACSDALYEYEGIDKGVSRRTTQLDIQTMRSSRLGYNAPIVVRDKKYYIYEDPDYSITNIPLTNQDLSLLNDVVATLEKFTGFTHFDEFGDIVKKLEDQLTSRQQKKQAIIDFERNHKLKGIQFIDKCYRAVASKSVLQITYQSFRARQPSQFNFHGQFLKEFNNRWFIVGLRQDQDPILTLAFDRISAVDIDEEVPYIDLQLDPAIYYENVIGVTVSSSTRPTKVEFLVNHANAPYVATKPFHHSQIERSQDKSGVVFQIEVQLNFELERLLLGFGAALVVIKPKRLRDKIKRILGNAHSNYAD